MKTASSRHRTRNLIPKYARNRTMYPIPRPATSKGKWEPILDQMVKEGIITSWEYMTLDGIYAPFVKVKFPGRDKSVITHHAAFFILFRLMANIKIHKFPTWLNSHEAEEMRKEIEEMPHEKDYFQKLRYEFLKMLFHMGGTPA